MKLWPNKQDLLVEADHSAVLKCVLVVDRHADVADDVFCEVRAT